ncbi:MAG: GAF domain-containing protein [Maribacter sp.]|nr:GAF domain-containing protein [Maribacter sp.]
MNKTVIFSCLCSICFQLTAQQYGYVQYNSSSGAPFDQVSTVIKDTLGFIWIGSENGLFRFDGIHYDNYSLHTESQFINQLTAKGDDLLFLNELNLYQIQDVGAKPEANALMKGSINEDDALPFFPTSFILGQDQEIWLSQSNHSIGRMQGGDFKNYKFSESDGAQELSLQKDLTGGIWALSPLDGLFFFDSSADSFERKLDLKNGNTLLIHKNLLLVGSDVLRVYSIQGNNLRLIKTIAIEDDFITAIHADQKDQYIIGTQKGKLLKLTDLNSPPQTVYGANEAHRVEELEFGHIHEIYVTTDSASDSDQLWIASDTGLWLLQERFFKTVNNLPLNNPIGIALGNEGNAWVPINYLYEISPDKDEFNARTIYNNLQANAVAQDIAGFTWVTTTTPKVELIKYDNNRVVKRYDFHERGEAIFNLYPDSKGNLWFCQAPLNTPIVGIAKINASGEISYYDDNKGFSSRVLAIKESSRGEIYAVGIGENSYLYRYNPAQDKFENLSPALPFEAILNFEAHDLTIDDRGVVWLATTDGLLRYDSENISLVQNDILKQEEVRGVTHSSNDAIWIATATKGLVYHHQNTSTALGELEGLPAVISAYRCITMDAQGRLWAGTAEGLVYSRMSAAALPYSNIPSIRKVTVQSREFTEDFDQVFRLNKSESLQLEFSNLSFPARKVHYEYRLLPAKDRQIMLEEQQWLSNGHSNILKLSPAELGDYFLELRARQPGGYQWSTPVEIRFNVFLPWYLRSWFIYGAIGLLLLLVGYYFRFYVKRRLKRFQKLLKYSNEKLADKEAQLHRKIREFEDQKAALANANSNIQTLELFIKEIPKNASWDDIIAAMGKAVNQAADINAFEIAFKEKNEIVHRGYSNQERSGYTFRSKPFNLKTSLTCWAMSQNEEVMINDFEKEHGMYIQEKDAYHFNSMLFVPFTLENGQPVVLCAYSLNKNDFDGNDLIMFRVIAQFIHFSIHHELTKKK